MNNSFVLIGLVSIVALVAVTAMVTQQTTNHVSGDNNIGYTTYPNVEYDFVPNTFFEGTDGSLYVTNAQGVVLGVTDAQQRVGESFDVYMQGPRESKDSRVGLVHTTLVRASIILFEDKKGTRYATLTQGQASWVLPLAPAGTNEASFDYYPWWQPTAQGNVAGFGYYPWWQPKARGNIVGQGTYPSVEYDFVPNTLE